MGKETSPATMKACKIAYLTVEALFILVTLAALAEALMGAHFGLSLTVFFAGLVASVWGAAAYPVCCGCCWEREQGERPG